MIYKLRASRRQFEILGSGDQWVKVRFLDRAAGGEETIATGDLEAASDWKRPAPEEPTVAPTAPGTPDYDYYGWV